MIIIRKIFISFFILLVFAIPAWIAYPTYKFFRAGGEAQATVIAREFMPHPTERREMVIRGTFEYVDQNGLVQQVPFQDGAMNNQCNVNSKEQYCYPIGTQVTVFYDPADPQKVIMDRTFPLIATIIFSFVCMGALIRNWFYHDDIWRIPQQYRELPPKP